MSKKKNILLALILVFFVGSINGAQNILAQTYCTGPCNTEVCGDLACSVEAQECHDDGSGCCEERVDSYGETYCFRDGCNTCELTQTSCPTGSTWGDNCCMVICPETDPDPSTPPGEEEEEGEEGGGGDGGFELEEGGGIGGPISGTVKQDDGRDAGLVGGLCSLGGAPGVEPGEGSIVDIASIDFDVNTDGTYTTPAISEGSYTVDLDVADTDTYTCTCPSGCVYGGIDDGTSGVDFYVTATRDAWPQFNGGNVHANSGNLSLTIPDTADTPYLITGEQGLVSYTGSLSLGDIDSTGISETANDWQAQTVYQGSETDYGYFARILSENPLGIDDWDGSDPGTGVFLSLRQKHWWNWLAAYAAAAETIETSGGDWTIPADQQTVLLTEKNVLISNNISVAEGGFLAIISAGDITIDDDVTNVEGVFVADNLINTCNSVSDLQLNAEGIFVGWDGVNLCRDFDDTRNNDDPAEIFTYRPDLQVNAYEYLLRPKYSWRELAP